MNLEETLTVYKFLANFHKNKFEDFFWNEYRVTMDNEVLLIDGMIMIRKHSNYFLIWNSDPFFEFKRINNSEINDFLDEYDNEDDFFYNKLKFDGNIPFDGNVPLSSKGGKIQSVSLYEFVKFYQRIKQ